MDRACPGVLWIRQRFSRVTTIRWTLGGETSKYRAMSCSAGGWPRDHDADRDRRGNRTCRPLSNVPHVSHVP